MRARIAFALLLVATPACKEETRNDGSDLELRVECDSTQIEFGKAVTFTITRRWSKELLPEALALETWAPLVLSAVETRRTEGEHQIEESVRYRAHVFTREDLPALPPLLFKARSRDFKQERTTSAPAPALRLVRGAESRPTGPPEVPSEFFPAPLAWQKPALLGTLVIAGLCIWAWQSRRRGAWPFASAAPAAVDPRARALATLAEVRERTPAAGDDPRATWVAAADAVRDYLAARFSVPAGELTSEELLAAPATLQALGAEGRANLAHLLVSCDRVKFSGELPGPAERLAMLDLAEELVMGSG